MGSKKLGLKLINFVGVISGLLCVGFGFKAWQETGFADVRIKWDDAGGGPFF